MKKQISWITPSYFVETDIYVVPELSKYYRVNWIITYAQTIPFGSELLSVERDNLTIVYKKETFSSMFSRCAFSFYRDGINTALAVSPDFIYTANLNYPFLLIALFKLPRSITTIAAHNVVTPKGSSHYLFNKIYSGLCFSFFKNFQNFSKSQYELMQSLYSHKNCYYAPFVMKDYGKTEVAPNDNCISFLFYGRIRGYKNPEVVIAAAQEVAKKTNKPFKVIIAGECNNWEEYEKLIYTPDLFDLRIRMIDNKDVPDLFGEAHYTLLPYKDIAQSGALFVCINYAKPSILTKLPAFLEVLTDDINALFLENDSVEVLIDKMLYVINNHEKVYPRLKNSLENLKDTTFNKEAIINKYKSFIESIINA